jgi:hypothetical protein
VCVGEIKRGLRDKEGRKGERERERERSRGEGREK